MTAHELYCHCAPVSATGTPNGRGMPATDVRRECRHALVANGRYGTLEVHGVHRFAEQWEKDASLRIREGDVTAVADYQARRRIYAGQEDHARRNMVLYWAADVAPGGTR